MINATNTIFGIGSNADVKAPPERRSKSRFVGLENQGATCYLNSLIQALYMTPELRIGLYGVDPMSIGADQLEEYCKDKQAGISVNGVIELDDVHSQPMELEAQDSCQEKRRQILKPPRFIPLELQKLFTYMQILDMKALTTEDLTKKAFHWEGADGHIQHDAHELNRLLIEALEKSLRKTSAESLCCNNSSEKSEHFYDILLQVNGFADIITSLRDYTAAELLTGANKYHCDSAICAGSKQEAHRSVLINTFPPILTFSCQRFDIDRTNWQRVKITSKFDFPLVLNMNKFSQSSNGVVTTKMEGEDEKKYVEGLRGEMVWLEEIYDSAKVEAEKLVKKKGIQFNLTTLPDIEFDIIRKRLLLPKKYQNESNNFEFDEKNVYQLFTIIMHKGTAYSGHYFAYIRDCTGEGSWSGPTFEEILKQQQSKKSIPKVSQKVKTMTTATVPVVVRPTSHVSDEMYVSDVTGNIIYLLKKTTLADLISTLKEMSKPLRVKEVLKKFYETTGRLWEESLFGTLKNFVAPYEDNLIKLSFDRKNPKTSPYYELVKGKEFHELDAAAFNELKLNYAGQVIESTDGTATSSTGTCIDHDDSNVVDMGSSSSSSSEASDETIAHNTAVAAIAEELVRRVHGSFYEFNDSEVTPMPLEAVCKAFEGRDSAYLVVYRQEEQCSAIRKLLRDPLPSPPPPHECSLRSIPGPGSGPNPPPGLVLSTSRSRPDVRQMTGSSMANSLKIEPPAFWLRKAEEMDASLRQARSSSMQNACQLDLHILFPVHLHSTQVDHLLYPRQHDTSRLDRLPDMYRDGIKLQITPDLPVGQLCSQLFVGTDVSLPLLGLESKDNLVFSRLNEYDDGLYILSPFNSDEPIGQAIKNQSSGSKEATSFLLAWDGKTVNNEIVQEFGNNNIPHKMNLTVVSCPIDNRLNVYSDNPIVIWINKSCLLPEVCEKVLLKLIESRPDLQSSGPLDIALVYKSKKSRGHNRGLYIVNIWSRDDFTSGILPGSRYRLETMSLSDLDSSELIIEPHTRIKSELAGLLVDERNKSLALIATVGFTGEQLACRWREVGDGSHADFSTCIDTPVSLELSGDGNIAHLITALIKHYSLPSLLLPHLSIVYKDGFYSDGNASLVSCGIVDGEYLRLDFNTSAVKPQYMDISICRVIGNNPLCRTAKSKQSGQRCDTVTVKVNISDTILSVKKKALELFYGQRDEEMSLVKTTEQEEGMDLMSNKDHTYIDPSTVRFRRTLWTSEGDALVEEREYLRASAKHHIEEIIEHSVDSIDGLMESNLLLLEDGAPFVKGLIDVNIQLWKPSFPLSQQSEDKERFKSSVSATLSEEKLETEDIIILNSCMIEPIMSTFQQEQVIDLGFITISADCYLEDVYVAVHSLLTECNTSCVGKRKQESLCPILRPSEALTTLISHGFIFPGIDEMLLRELRAFILPGRCLYRCPKDPNSSDQKIRIMNVKGDKPIIITPLLQPSLSLLSPPENNISKTSDEKDDITKLWLYKVENAMECKIKGCMAIMSPIWPPLEIEVHGNKLEHFKIAIQQKLCLSLQLENIRVYKFVETKGSWIELKHKPKLTKNFLNPPYSLKEGDILCAFDNVPDDGSDLTIEREIHVKGKEFYERNDHIMLKKKKGMEIALKIGSGSLDFSSDDEVNDVEGKTGRGKERRKGNEHEGRDFGISVVNIVGDDDLAM